MNKAFLSTICMLALGGTSALAQGTTAERKALEEFSKYEQTGEFTKCVQHSMISKSTIVDDSRIMFRLKGGKYVLNTLSNECRRLGFDRQFHYDTSNGKLCSKDIISTKRGNCNLGEFEVLQKKTS